MAARHAVRAWSVAAAALLAAVVLVAVTSMPSASAVWIPSGVEWPLARSVPTIGQNDALTTDATVAMLDSPPGPFPPNLTAPVSVQPVVSAWWARNITDNDMFELRIGVMDMTAAAAAATAGATAAPWLLSMIVNSTQSRYNRASLFLCPLSASSVLLLWQVPYVDSAAQVDMRVHSGILQSANAARSQFSFRLLQAMAANKVLRACAGGFGDGSQVTLAFADGLRVFDTATTNTSALLASPAASPYPEVSTLTAQLLMMPPRLPSEDARLIVAFKENPATQMDETSYAVYRIASAAQQLLEVRAQSPVLSGLANMREFAGAPLSLSLLPDANGFLISLQSQFTSMTGDGLQVPTLPRIRGRRFDRDGAPIDTAEAKALSTLVASSPPWRKGPKLAAANAFINSDDPTQLPGADSLVAFTATAESYALTQTTHGPLLVQGKASVGPSSSSPASIQFQSPLPLNKYDNSDTLIRSLVCPHVNGTATSGCLVVYTTGPSTILTQVIVPAASVYISMANTTLNYHTSSGRLRTPLGKPIGTDLLALTDTASLRELTIDITGGAASDNDVLYFMPMGYWLGDFIARRWIEAPQPTLPPASITAFGVSISYSTQDRRLTLKGEASSNNYTAILARVYFTVVDNGLSSFTVSAVPRQMTLRATASNGLVSSAPLSIAVNVTRSPMLSLTTTSFVYDVEYRVNPADVHGSSLSSMPHFKPFPDVVVSHADSSATKLRSATIFLLMSLEFPATGAPVIQLTCTTLCIMASGATPTPGNPAVNIMRDSSLGFTTTQARFILSLNAPNATLDTYQAVLRQIVFQRTDRAAGNVQFSLQVSDGTADSNTVSVSTTPLAETVPEGAGSSSSSSDEDTIRNAIIGSAASGGVGLLFFLVRLLVQWKSDRAMLRLTEAASESERHLARMRSEVIRPLLQRLFAVARTTNLSGYRSDATTKALMDCMERIVALLSEAGVVVDLNAATPETVLRRTRLLSEIVHQTTKLALRKRNCITRVLLGELYPEDLAKKEADIAAGVLQALRKNSMSGSPDAKAGAASPQTMLGSPSATEMAALPTYPAAPAATSAAQASSSPAPPASAAPTHHRHHSSSSSGGKHPHDKAKSQDEEGHEAAPITVTVHMPAEQHAATSAPASAAAPAAVAHSASSATASASPAAAASASPAALSGDDEALALQRQMMQLQQQMEKLMHQREQQHAAHPAPGPHDDAGPAPSNQV